MSNEFVQPEDLNPKTGLPRRKHSEATKKLMSERRRARTVQPRSGQSTKRQNFISELEAEWKKCRNPKKKKEALAWIKAAKKLYGKETIEDAKRQGISTEYTEMYSACNEHMVGQVLYDDEDVHNQAQDKSNPYNMLDDVTDFEFVDPEVFGQKTTTTTTDTDEWYGHNHLEGESFGE